jgi:penicillin-binding protein 1A
MMSMASALQQSRNVVAVRLMQLTGPERVIQMARKMGIKGKLNPFYSLALGAADLTVLEMADAVSTIPNGGVRVPATGIKMITDRDGNVVIDNRFPSKKDVLSESTASAMMEMMRGVVLGGTGTAAYMPDHEAAGKTGTTDSFRDAWFVGYTKDFTTAVWCGNDDYSQMWNSFGGDVPATIWRQVMVTALRNHKPSKLPITNPSKVGVLMCADSKQRVGPHCPNFYRELFPRHSVPYQFCAQHGAPSYAPASGVSTGKDDSSKPSPTDAAAKAAAETTAPPPAVDPNSAPIPTEVEIPTEIPVEPAPVEVPVSSDVAPVVPETVELPPPPPEPVELPPPPEPVEVPIAPPQE